MNNRALELIIILIAVFYVLGAFTTLLPMGRLAHLLLAALVAMVILRFMCGRQPVTR